MTFLLAHIPLLFGAACSIVLIISMSAITMATFHYLRVMEASQVRSRAEEETRGLRRR